MVWPRETTKTGGCSLMPRPSFLSFCVGAEKKESIQWPLCHTNKNGLCSYCGEFRVEFREKIIVRQAHVNSKLYCTNTY